MKIVTLLENTACCEELRYTHGLSLYLETAKHKILVDMGPNDDYLENAKKLGVDLTQVDIAILSHGHWDHAGGLAAFCALNPSAKIYLHEQAFGDYYHVDAEETRYIGIDQELDRTRFLFTGAECVIDDELTLFSKVSDDFGALGASASLFSKTAEGFTPDMFEHEQNLLIATEGKTVLVAGCAHRGIVNILQAAEKRLGHRPDMTFGGFHLFQLAEGDRASEELIEKTGKALLEGGAVYYTGHCTGDYAYNKLKDILGDRLQPMTGGAVVEI